MVSFLLSLFLTVAFRLYPSKLARVPLVEDKVERVHLGPRVSHKSVVRRKLEDTWGNLSDTEIADGKEGKAVEKLRPIALRYYWNKDR